MVASSLRLSPKMERAALMIAEGWTQVRAASKEEGVDVSKQTMNRWCKDPDFIARVQELRSSSSKQADEILEMGVPDAADTVVGIANGKIGPDYDENGKPDNAGLNARLRAALYILEDRKKKTKSGQTSKRPGIGDRAFIMNEDEADELLDRGK